MIRLDKLVGARLLSACAGTGAPYLAAEGDVSQPILTEEQIEPQPSPGGAGAVARSSWALFRIRFMRDRAAVAGAVIIIVLIVLALAAPLFKLIVHHGPNDLFGSTMLTPDLGLPKGPNGTFWFGADQVGRDVFLRTIYGIRTSLVIAFVATGLASLIGVVLGLSAGFVGGFYDTAVSRLLDLAERLPARSAAAGAQPGDRHHRALHLAQHRSHRSRPGPFVAGARVHRGGAIARRAQLLDHVPRAAAEPGRADRRLHLADHPEQHPVRGRPVVPGRRRPAVHPVVGSHAFGRHQWSAVHLRVVDDGLPRSVPGAHHALVQPGRRRAP